MDSQIPQEIMKKKKWYLPVIIVSGVVIFAAIVSIIVIISVVAVPKAKAGKQLALGDKYISEMDYENAVLAYREAIQIDPRNEKAYLALADAYISLADKCLAEGDKEGAIRYLNKGIKEISPGADKTDSDEISEKEEEMEDKKAEIEDDDTEDISEEDDSNNKNDKTDENDKKEGSEEEGKKKQELAECYSAYLDYLKSHPQIKNNTIQKTGTAKPVAICDVYGDDRPELIYLLQRNESVGVDANDLYILTYDGSKISTIFTFEELDVIVGGTFSYYLFQRENEKNLYIMRNYSGENTETYYYRLEDSGNALKKTTVVSIVEYAEYYNMPDEYGVRGSSVSSSEAQKEINSLNGNIIQIVMCKDLQYLRSNKTVVQSKTNIEMTYDEAIAFLENQISANGLSDKEETDEKEEKPEIRFSSKDALEQLKHAVANTIGSEFEYVDYDFADEYLSYQMVHTSSDDKIVYLIN